MEEGGGGVGGGEVGDAGAGWCWGGGRCGFCCGWVGEGSGEMAGVGAEVEDMVEGAVDVLIMGTGGGGAEVSMWWFY